MGVITRPRDANDPFYRSNSRDYAQAYHDIVSAARSGGSSASSSSASTPTPVLVLVSSDIDGLCAAKTLVSLLTDDEVPYKICPVDGYSTLTRVVEDDVERNRGLHTIIMLNMGSILSLPDFFTSASDPMPGAHVLPDSCHIHLIDSHRPYNLDNLFATSTLTERIHVWDDGEVEERLGREGQAYSALEFLDDESSEEESEESEGSEEEDAGEEGGPRKRVKRSDEGKKRLPPNVIASHRKVMTRYYNRGATYGMSIAGMMFMLGEKLGRGGNESLWMAILGLTSQYISSQIPHGHYNDLSKALGADVVALNPASNATAASRGPDEGRIRVVKKELRFTLYRHWSLEASMYHSSYVAGKMGIWKEQGMAKLQSFMAKMGLSLSQCRETFEHMDLDLRHSLVERIESIAPEYEMSECIYRSFLRTFGFRSPAMSAADVVEGLEALLCAAHGVRIEVDTPSLAFGGVGAPNQDAYSMAMGGPGQGSDLFSSRKLWQLGKNGSAATSNTVSPAPISAPGKENKEPWQGGSEDVGDSDGTAVESEQDGKRGNPEAAYWMQNFFTAFTALDTRKRENLNMLRASLNLSKSLHDIVIRQGVMVIEKQLVRTLRNFRLVVLKEGNHLELFRNTQVLTRLGLWLVDALRDLVELHHKQRKQPKGGKDESANSPTNLPFVIAALNDNDETYTVVGINASMQYGDVLRNNFGFRFQQAIQASHSRSKHDKFETSAVEVRKEDFGTFVEALHGIL